jgi:hypothetical protein
MIATRVMFRGILYTRSYEIHIVVVNPFRLVCLLDLCAIVVETLS